MTRRAQPGKRLLDLAITVPAFLLLLPLMAITALAVTLGLGRPILFRQKRPGLLGETFEVVKFRSMLTAQDPEAHLKSDEPRLTALGTFLRKTSLDELPQLWNVIRGDMSLVGPRPLLMEYFPNYSAEHQRRHTVVPGITGWAQIHGRNAAKFSERLAMDIWYVDHWSLGLDLTILARTFLKVMQSSGVKHCQPTEEFDDLGLHPETRRNAAQTAPTSPNP